MPARIRARYADGVLTPLDPVDLQEGVELAIAIDTAQPEIPAPTEPDQRRNRFSMTREEKQDLLNKIPSLAEAAAWIKEFEQREQEPPPDGEPQGLAAIVALVEELHSQMPDDAWDDVPTDLAQNKHHYRFGTPKEEDE